ncbi:MAG TPA: flagellar hook-length control protein FliK [Stellaceae bacterium]|nr:flagellar hook-length control protein FliK [Stellaceae bacterium]
MPVADVSEGARAAEAAALGAPGEPAALANAPTAAVSPAMGAEAAATVASQVANHVVRMVSSGSREMEIRLHPPELGEVSVRVVVNGRDVSAWFGSLQPHVQTAIADGIGQLQAGLGNAGYNLNGAWVGADASGARQPAGGPPPLAARTPIAASSLNVGTAAASRPSASGLNIYV